MQDPYSILGINRDASDEEIKKTYRKLSRKYHPDANINNPNKEQAEARFKEVQQAYQQIMKEKEFGESGYGSDFGGNGPFGGFYGTYTNGDSRNRQQESDTDLHLKAAANYIQSGHYSEALNVLNGISDRPALWYFYSAAANSGAGNNVAALNHAREAVRFEPGNVQYQMLLRQLESGGSWYENMRSPYGRPGAQGDSWCMKLCIANLVCNLCCGSGCCYGRPI